MNNHRQVTPHQLRKGDIVRLACGRFEVVADPVESQGHRPEGYWPQDSVGPSDCVSAMAVCIEGTVPGYFQPGSKWNFQGNHQARFVLEASAA